MGYGDMRMVFRKTTGTIRPDSPRHAGWVEIFGSDTIPLEGPTPHRVLSPNGIAENYYMLDLSSLSDDVRDRLIAHLSRTFGISEEVVRGDLEQGEGVPILAKHVTVAFDARHVL